MKAYKLTDKNGQTKNKTKWGEGITHTVEGNERKLCTSSWIHFYTNPLIAVIMNSTQANFVNPLLWECETSGEELHEPLKSGCKTLTTIKQIPLPEINDIQKIAFSILCAKEVYSKPKWNEWANKWLSGEDRTKSSAFASYAATVTSYAASATYAAAIYATATSYATSYAASATYAAAIYAYAIYAVELNKNIDFVALINKAMTYK